MRTSGGWRKLAAVALALAVGAPPGQTLVEVDQHGKRFAFVIYFRLGKGAVLYISRS